MEKMRKILQDMSLRKSMVFYVAVFLVPAILLSTGTSLFCSHAVDRIYGAYSVSGERYYLTNDQGERLGDGAIISSDPSVSSLSASDQRRIAFLELFPSLAIPVYSGLCILAAALLFYQNKLLSHRQFELHPWDLSI